jgi:hypothetical protein
MNVPHQERDARLLPVVGCILVCYVVILGGSYFIGNYVF